jgi:predicted CoA-binding protein
MFLDRLFSRFRNITWPACSPDLAVPDYFLCGYVKSNVYETHPVNPAQLTQKILKCIQGIPKERLHVMTAFAS